MRYAPYQEEVIAMQDFSDGQLMDYFLTRVFETEEVWGLDDGCEWVLQRKDSQLIMSIWPYQHFAKEMSQALASDLTPCAESLEDFLYQTLGALIEEDILLEIMAMPGKSGCLVSPQRLYDIFTGMIDAGEYTLDS